MKQQQGFTLIELIIVIVILGILAVTAAPRFIDIQSDARKEVLQGVKGALNGASQLVFAKSAIAGEQKTDTGQDVVLGPVTTNIVVTRFGYPDADSITTAEILQRFVDVELGSDAQLTFVPGTDIGSAAVPNTFRIRYTSIPTDSSDDGCYIQYISATAEGTTPVISVNDDNC